MCAKRFVIRNSTVLGEKQEINWESAFLSRVVNHGMWQWFVSKYYARDLIINSSCCVFAEGVNFSSDI